MGHTHGPWPETNTAMSAGAAAHAIMPETSDYTRTGVVVVCTCESLPVLAKVKVPLPHEVVRHTHSAQPSISAQGGFCLRGDRMRSFHV